MSQAVSCQKVGSSNPLNLILMFVVSDVKVVNGPNGETVATVDEVAGLKYRTSENGTKDEMATVGMRMMISNNFAPKTRLRMASRLLIMEVKITVIKVK